MITPVQFFKCLADDTRLRCVTMVQRHGKLCVCELTQALALSQPKISRHLAQLRQCGVLIDSREGQWVYYRLHPQLPEWALTTLASMVSAVELNEVFQQDQERLQRMACRPELSVCC